MGQRHHNKQQITLKEGKDFQYVKTPKHKPKQRITLEEGKDFEYVAAPPNAPYMHFICAIIFAYIAVFTGYIPGPDLLNVGLGFGWFVGILGLLLRKSGVNYKRNYPLEICFMLCIMGWLYSSGFPFYIPLIIIVAWYICTLRKS